MHQDDLKKRMYSSSSSKSSSCRIASAARNCINSVPPTALPFLLCFWDWRLGFLNPRTMFVHMLSAAYSSLQAAIHVKTRQIMSLLTYKNSLLNIFQFIFVYLTGNIKNSARKKLTKMLLSYIQSEPEHTQQFGFGFSLKARLWTAPWL